MENQIKLEERIFRCSVHDKKYFCNVKLKYYHISLLLKMPIRMFKKIICHLHFTRQITKTQYPYIKNIAGSSATSKDHGIQRRILRLSRPRVYQMSSFLSFQVRQMCLWCCKQGYVLLYDVCKYRRRERFVLSNPKGSASQKMNVFVDVYISLSRSLICNYVESLTAQLLVPSAHVSPLSPPLCKLLGETKVQGVIQSSYIVPITWIALRQVCNVL